MTARTDALLCSINDRLGGGPGQDVPPLGDAWLQDLYWLVELEGEYDRKRKDADKRNLTRRRSPDRAFQFPDEEDF